jgi:RNA-directed DNA polymerase
MAQAGWTMTRYADDFVILCRTQADAERALAAVQDWTGKAGLILHPVKTRIVDLGQPRQFIDFLGFRLQRQRDKDGRDRILRLVRPKSLAKVTETIRQRTRRTHGDSLEVIILQLNQVLGGWSAYFRSAHRSIHHRLDQTVRRRLRAILAKRRGIPNWGGGHGHNRWPNAFFTEHGLLSLADAHARHLHPC